MWECSENTFNEIPITLLDSDDFLEYVESLINVFY